MAFLHPQAPTLASNLLLTWKWKKMGDKVVRAVFTLEINNAKVQAQGTIMIQG